MKHRNRLIGILLLLAALSLLTFGVFQSRSQATSTAPISFAGFTTEPIPVKQRNRSNPFAPDTLVKIKINIAQNFLTRRVFPQYLASKIRVKNEHLIDTVGVKYFLTAPANSLAPKGKINAAGMLIDGDGSAITYHYQLNLEQYPKTAGAMTFHATYLAGNGFQLPVSVKVRK